MMQISRAGNFCSLALGSVNWQEVRFNSVLTWASLMALSAAKSFFASPRSLAVYCDSWPVCLQMGTPGAWASAWKHPAVVNATIPASVTLKAGCMGAWYAGICQTSSAESEEQTHPASVCV